MRLLAAGLLVLLSGVPSISAAVELCSSESQEKLKAAGVTAEQIARVCPAPESASAETAGGAASDGTAAASPAGPRPRVGLALGGGGARGIAHIGVIRALEQLNVPIDYIAGTSMGSIIAGLYACGYTPDEMENLVRSIDWPEIFNDAPRRPDQPFRVKEDDYLHLAPFELGLKLGNGGIIFPPALVAGNRLGFVLTTATQPCASITNFDELRIPFRAVATDIQTGESFVMGSGNLATSLRASMAIPAAFTPVEIDGHLLIDGGEAQNLPVPTVRAMGADIVIGVNVGSSGGATAAKPKNVGEMLERLIALPLQQNTQASAKLADLVITPNLDGYGSADFVKGLEMVPLGYQAALADKDELQQWSAPEATYAAWKAQHDTVLPPPPFIDRIGIDRVAGVDPRRLEGMIRVKAGQPLDSEMLAEDLTQIYGLGNFESVRYTIVPDGEQNPLLISAVPKSWGPTYLSGGLSLATDFDVTTEFGITALVDARELNRFGGQWKTSATIGYPVGVETRFYQPLGYDSRFFLSPFLGFGQYNEQFWNNKGDKNIATGAVRQIFDGIDLGYDFGNSAQLRVGFMRSNRDFDVDVGFVENFPPTYSNNEGAITAQLMIDRLDDVSLPQSGYFVHISYLAQREDYGAIRDYDLFSARVGAAGTIGRWTGNVGLEYDTTLTTNSPVLDRFALGGLFRLSGRPINNLRGEILELATGQVYYRLAGTDAGLIKNVSVGGSLEIGNTKLNKDRPNYKVDRAAHPDLITAGSVFVITETVIGPFFLGYGQSQEFNSFYLYLNRSFGALR